MTCAAAKKPAAFIQGKFVLKAEGFLSLCKACGFHNVDARVAPMFMTDTALPGERRWEALSLETRPDIIEVAATNPQGHFGVKELLAWEVETYPSLKNRVYRAVALGASIMVGDERYFLFINRQNRGLKTLGFVLEQSIPLLPDVYCLRTW